VLLKTTHTEHENIDSRWAVIEYEESRRSVAYSRLLTARHGPTSIDRQINLHTKNTIDQEGSVKSMQAVQIDSPKLQLFQTEYFVDDIMQSVWKSFTAK
jgi:hypothetical protein